MITQQTAFKYYDFSRNWSKLIEPVMASQPAQYLLQRDFEKYANLQRRNYIQYARQKNIQITGTEWLYSPNKMPIDYDSCDWRCDRRRLPAWGDYVCHGACHFIVNTLLYVACAAIPTKAWQIVTSDEHSVVWDGHNTLFDLNFVTLQIPIDECVAVTFKHPSCRILQVGEYLKLEC
jgi:hypothetical protein